MSPWHYIFNSITVCLQNLIVNMTATSQFNPWVDSFNLSGSKKLNIFHPSAAFRPCFRSLAKSDVLLFIVRNPNINMSSSFLRASSAIGWQDLILCCAKKGWLLRYRDLSTSWMGLWPSKRFSKASLAKPWIPNLLWTTALTQTGSQLRRPVFLNNSHRLSLRTTASQFVIAPLLCSRLQYFFVDLEDGWLLKLFWGEKFCWVWLNYDWSTLKIKAFIVLCLTAIMLFFPLCAWMWKSHFHVYLLEKLFLCVCHCVSTAEQINSSVTCFTERTMDF